MEAIANIAIPGDAGATTCGYCSPPGQRSQYATSYHAATLEALKLSCGVYQGMINRGWRRSGTYCYKPDLKVSCCPQYTIKLDGTVFNPSAKQRKLLNRWNRYVLQGDAEDAMVVNSSTGGSEPKSKSKPKKGPPFTSLATTIHESEISFQAEVEPTHRFETILEPSSYTPQKFALYQKYQTDIHHDTKNSSQGFKRFLVDSPLTAEPINYTSPPPKHLPLNYGSHHQLYMLDGKLIAMAVLDILPNCVSSVYFMYDKAWERFSLGKLSALREVSLVREMREAGAPEMTSLYMGFYIYSCQKMRYKGEYSPSYLVDPETYEWFPLEFCIPLLEKYRYACFSQPSHSTENGHDDDDDDDDLSDDGSPQPELEDFSDIKVIVRTEAGDFITKPIHDTRYLSLGEIGQQVSTCIRGLGRPLAKEIAFGFYV
ncbi:arginine-tRNA-protein transferase [Crassisporium funariophilum]|nr:arginine-tRNA-protein transferase [Crassisporium funariophilum]